MTFHSINATFSKIVAMGFLSKQLGFFLLLSSGLFSQQGNIPLDRYYIGTGIGEDLEKARSDAYHSLVQQIQVFVTSSIQRYVAENNKSYRDSTSLNTIAQSSITLTDVGELIDNVNAKTFRIRKYVSKENVQKLFTLRRQKILEHIRIADEEISKGGSAGPINLGSALKNYYWAFLLAVITPDSAAIALSPRVANKMESVTHNITFRSVKKIEDENIVWKYAVEYKSRPVSGLRYSFFDGMGQTDGEVRDGQTKLTFYFSANDKREREVEVSFECRYEDEMDELLRLAESVRGSSPFVLTSALVLPGEKGAATPKSFLLPAPLKELMQNRDSFEAAVETLNKLEKQNRIVVGSDKQFESKEGLYRLVVAKDGIVALLKFEENKYYNVLTGDEIELRTFSGKRMTWIEVLK